MKTIILLFSVSILFSQTLDGRYHTYEEIHQQLLDWQEEFGTEPNVIPQYPESGIIYQFIEIGYSTNENLPIWAVKLSYNADVKEDEPRILILGQCHAEEILGVEISMAVIDWFLHPLEHVSIFTTTLRPILRNTEIWVVPTHNPEGLRVVHGYEEDGETVSDVTFRKNKSDINIDGLFTYQNGVGNDSDGVDLNRNYPFNWMFGDSAFMLDPGYGDYFAHYDYFKGFEPSSESEIQTIQEFAREQNFLLSIAYHSSRSGRVAEMVIYSWDWEESKKSPDYPVIDQLGQEIAVLIPKEVDVGYYLATPSKSRRGNAHDWFYTETGCIQYLIEVGTENIQPDSLIIEDTIERNMDGVFHLMNRSFYNLYGNADAYQVTGLVTDAQTGNPVKAEVRILEMEDEMVKPRMTDEFGRFRRLLQNSMYTMEVSAKGYENQEFSISPSAGVVTTQNVELNQLPEYEVTMHIESNDEVLIIINDDYGADSTFTTSDNVTFQLPQNEYEIYFGGEEIFPKIVYLPLITDTSFTVQLNGYQTIFSESFNSLENWDVLSGDWIVNSGLLKSQSGLMYENSIDQFIVTSENISNPGGAPIAWNFSWKYELEWGQDSVIISIITDDDTISNYWVNQQWNQHDEIVVYPEVTLDSFKIGIGLRSDETVNYRGLQINEIQVIAENETLQGVDPVTIPERISILQPYPNPFNPTLTISFEIYGKQELEISVLNLQGRKVDSIQSDRFKSGINKIVWENPKLPSGIYFIKFESEDFIEIKKIMLLK